MRKPKIKKIQFISFISLAIGLVISLVYFKKDQVYKYISKASGQEANLIVLTKTQTQSKKPIWPHLAQGGEDLTTNMLTPVSDQIKSLEPQSIRIDHIFDGYDVVSKDSSGQLVFNWTRLDDLVNKIVSLNASPMLSLSYIPPAISSGDITDAPNDWNQWSLLVQKTIEHYSRDLAIPNVAYEVWNEPDLFGNWKTYGSKNYLTLYHYSALGASRVKKARPFLLGGPAITAAYPAWFNRLFSFVEKNNLRLDFISWHHYSKDINNFTKDINIVKKSLARHPAFSNIKLFITESGPNSESDTSYDDVLGAAHLVASTAVLLDKIDRLYTFEIVDGLDPNNRDYWGRWGLLTHPSKGGFIKPRYQALTLLNSLKGKFLAVNGQGSWVKAIATKDASTKTISILAVNYDPYGYHFEVSPLAISQLDPGQYDISMSLLNGGLVKSKLNTSENGTINLSLNLPAQAIMLIKIIPSNQI